MSPGAGPIVAAEVRAALRDMTSPPRVHAFAVGLGGRNVPLNILPRAIEAALSDDGADFRVLDVSKEELEPAHP